MRTRSKLRPGWSSARGDVAAASDRRAADEGAYIKPVIIATPAKTGERESRETPVTTMATTAKAAQVARMAWTSTSVVETPAAMVATTTAAQTAEWARRPNPGPFRKPRETLTALVKLLPQLY